MRLDERFEGSESRRLRARAASYLLGPKEDDHQGEDAVYSILGFFESVGYYWKQKLIDDESVWNFFSHWLLLYVAAADTQIKYAQSKDSDAFTILVAMNDAMKRFKQKTQSGRDLEHMFSAAEIVEKLKDELNLYLADETTKQPAIPAQPIK